MGVCLTTLRKLCKHSYYVGSVVDVSDPFFIPIGNDKTVLCDSTRCGVTKPLCSNIKSPKSPKLEQSIVPTLTKKSCSNIFDINIQTLCVIGLSPNWKPEYSEAIIYNFLFEQQCKVVKLSTLLKGMLDFTPTENDFIIVIFKTQNGKKYKVPYCLAFTDEDFPYLKNSNIPPYDKIVLVENLNHKLTYTPVDMFVRDFYWDMFRPHAWKFLRHLSSDPDAVLCFHHEQDQTILPLRLETGQFEVTQHK